VSEWTNEWMIKKGVNTHMTSAEVTPETNRPGSCALWMTGWDIVFLRLANLFESGTKMIYEITHKIDKRVACKGINSNELKETNTISVKLGIWLGLLRDHSDISASIQWMINFHYK